MLDVIAFPDASVRRFRTLRATGAVLTGVSAIFLASGLLDVALREAGLADPHYVLTFIAHSWLGALGCYLTASLAPRGRTEFVAGLAALAFLLGIVGAVALSSSWYPFTVVVSVIPAALFGTRLAER